LLPLGTVVEEDRRDCLFARGKVSGDVEQLAGARGSITFKLVHQLLASGAGDERPDDISVCDVGELGALLGETPDEVTKRLISLLSATPMVLGVPGRTYVP
jgi:hypothetical protein